MANDSTTQETATKKQPLTESFYFKADGTEADSPLDNVVKFKFRLVAADREWTRDYSDFRAACEMNGVDPAAVNVSIALDAFGAKTKWNNLANSIRNGKLKGTEEANPAAQAASIDEFIEEANKGNWRGEVGEGLTAGTADLAEAIARWQRAKGKPGDVVALKAALDAMSKEDRAARRNHPEITAELAKIRAERAATKAAGTKGDDSLLNM